MKGEAEFEWLLTKKNSLDKSNNGWWWLGIEIMCDFDDSNQDYDD